MAEAKKESQKPAPAKKTQSNKEKFPKRIHRSTSDKMIAGVCGGFAEHFGIEANVLRIIWFVAVFFGGFGVAAYILSWIILPANNNQSVSTKKTENNSRNSSMLWGLILVFLGAIFLLRRVDWFDYPYNWRWHWQPFDFWHFDFDWVLPIALIAFGAFYLIKTFRDDKESAPVNNPKTSGGKTMEKKLTRSTTDKMLGGVCGGIAAHFGWDPSLVRIGFVLLSIFPGEIIFGIIVYVVMLIVVPEETAVQTTSTAAKATSAKSKKK